MRSAVLLFVIVGLALAAGGGRLAYIQHTDGPALRERVARLHTACGEIPAQRGEILDAQARLLAGSERKPSIYADPAQLADARDRHYAAYSVAPLLGLSPLELEQLLAQRVEDRFVWIKRGVSEEELRQFLEVRNGRRLYGFNVQYEPLRMYPHGPLAAQVLGYVGAPDKGVPHGQAGIELAFDEVLTGTPGFRKRTVDVRRRNLRTHVEDYVAPRDGGSVVLTIDTYVQQQTETHLKNAVETFKAEWGTSVVLDPQSGEVLAMASYPAFDPADPVPAASSLQEVEDRLRNRAIADAYEPGSIFKPYIAACALDENVTRLDEIFSVNGPARSFGSRTIHDTHAYGALPLHEVISRSSNIGMSLLGHKVGNERLYRYLRLYGFGDATGITLPGEHTGLVQDFSRWTSFSTCSIPIGQEVAVTALQVATGFSVFCNGGILLRPRIVRGVIDADGNTLLDNSQPIAVRRVISTETAARFREEALIEVVMSKIGTGKRAAIANYRVFGKTGTAQVAKPGGGGYLPGKYMGSFVGGAPGDHPRVVAVVSLCKPSAGKYYGGTVSAPAVGEILAATLDYMKVPPEMTLEAPSGIMGPTDD